MQVLNCYPRSEEEYLALEARSPVRHEYVDGNVYAMTGASLRHNVIAGNIYALLRAHLRGTPCRTFMSDTKLRVARTRAYYYPDVLVTCDPRHQTISPEDMVVDAPRVVVEVLSVNTEGTDRREKMLAYKSLSSLQEYVLVRQDEAGIEIHRRLGDVAWEVAILQPGDPVELKSIDFAGDFRGMYEEAGVELAPSEGGSLG